MESDSFSFEKNDGLIVWVEKLICRKIFHEFLSRLCKVLFEKIWKIWYIPNL